MKVYIIQDYDYAESTNTFGAVMSHEALNIQNLWDEFRRIYKVPLENANKWNFELSDYSIKAFDKLKADGIIEVKCSNNFSPDSFIPYFVDWLLKRKGCLLVDFEYSKVATKTKYLKESRKST
ncbi:MAG: hypothetical protein KME47_09595 [Nodosilinea sp. WJT8-NPBG4]|jgi:hypothetical protein|nr:hypothetical protein [Nodosilinea sp. WJT8-NPBG4]